MSVNYFYFLQIIIICGMLSSELHAKEFTSYWNVPSFACSIKFNLPVLNVTERYGITQNSNDNFRGDQVSILYNPGLFPTLMDNASSSEIIHINGGVPQDGNLTAHLEMFEKHVNEIIPDRENSGLAIIDFELWRPVYRQNFGKFQPYKEVSIKRVQVTNPSWSRDDVEREAQRLFTEHAKLFLVETIELAKQLRPKAKWGYYGLPLCFNGRENAVEDCEESIQNDNDATQWLYDSSDIIFPSVYMTKKISPENRPKMVRGRIKEAIRLSTNVQQKKKPLVIAYHRYKFTDSSQYLNKTDNLETIQALKTAGADGIIIWGAWKDLNTEEKCIEFYDYLENNLGPIVQSASFDYTENDLGPVVNTSCADHMKNESEPNVQSSGRRHYVEKIQTNVLVCLFICFLSMKYYYQ